MKALLQQGFDIFNVYGKEPEALSNILQAFMIVLEKYHMDHIITAFHEWLRTATVMPTPADILRLTQEAQAHHNATRGPGGRAMPADPIPVKTVEWAYLLYPQVQARGLVEHVKKHIGELNREKGADAAHDYCKYLKTMCGFPADFAAQCGLSSGEKP